MESSVTPAAQKVLQAYNNSRDAFTSIISDSENAMRYVLNRPYTSAQLSYADEHDKPALKYNILIPILNVMIGNEQLARRRALFKPLSPQQSDLTQIIQGRWNAIVDENEVENKIAIAFMDSLIAPVGGWIERRFAMNDEGYLDFNYEVANNLRIFPDSEMNAADYELDKCRYIVKEGWDTLDNIIARYEVDSSIRREKKIGWFNQLRTYIRRYTENYYSSGSSPDVENDRYKILEMLERVSQRMYRAYDPLEKQYLILSPEKFRKEKSRNPDLQYLTDFYQRGIHITTVIPHFDNMVVQDEDSPAKSANFGLFHCNSYSLNVQVSENTSLIDLLTDIQDDINSSMSQKRDYITQIAAAATVVYGREPEVVKELKKKGNSANLVLNPMNYASKIERLNPGSISPELILTPDQSIQFSDRISMQNHAMRGEAGRSGESGYLFQKKVERAAAAINPYFKNVSILRKLIAKDFVDNLSYVYSEVNRPVRIKTSERDKSFDYAIFNLEFGAQILNNVQNASIMVELDEGDNNITAHEENFEKILALANLISQVNPRLVDVRFIVENATIANVDRWLQYIDQQTQNISLETQDAQDMSQTRELLEQMKTLRGMQLEGDKTKKPTPANQNV
ncbi:MAG: hypothetical protein PHC43_01310 [Candidatus Marinimicrobia bacterium]|nr:hypothetical protein [Candidatus Neomarinimicrobiota bacterium]MDD5229948.1 hypothetical protein [Candidatus Neomarinimicrobiota bacterium]MDD5540140.1 hypothetical protein [Candidatus Neomarinimicrobiota bacterium]